LKLVAKIVGAKWLAGFSDKKEEITSRSIDDRLEAQVQRYL
jgi:hypothetical protein